MPRRRAHQTGLQVQAKQCETCIYFPKSGFDIKELEAQIADPYMDGFFKGSRACHHAPGTTVVCRGFWNRHKDDYAAGQIAQRLGLVRFVTVDNQHKENDTWTSSSNSRKRARTTSTK